jgi:signal transduction histidine kinase
MFNILSNPIKFSKVNSDIDIVARKSDYSIKLS